MFRSCAVTSRRWLFSWCWFRSCPSSCNTFRVGGRPWLLHSSGLQASVRCFDKSNSLQIFFYTGLEWLTGLQASDEVLLRRKNAVAPVARRDLVVPDCF